MLPLILSAFIAAAPIRAAERLVPMETELVPAGSPVLLRIGPDSIPIGYADSGRILLTKRKDSARFLPRGRRLVISELAIRRARETLLVTGETWIARKPGTVIVSFATRDTLGNADSLRARLETTDIDQVFLRLPVAGRMTRKGSGDNGFGTAFCALTGGVIGVVYGELHHGRDGSTPGAFAFYSGLAGALIGAAYGFQFDFLDG